MLQHWQRFIEGLEPEGPLSGIILESWQRCRSFQVDAARANLRRLPFNDLRARLQRNEALVNAARPHLSWALASMAPLHPVVVMLTDADGVIIDSVGNAPEVMTTYGLIPGYDWSEGAMGTNGIGTALAFGAPVAVIGVEHYTQTWHNNTCVGSPIRDAEGRIVGAVDISTTAADGDPARLVLVSFLAHVIGSELGGRQEGKDAFAGAAVLERATAEGSSASSEVLEKHASELEALAPGLREFAQSTAGARSVPVGEVVDLLDVLRETVGAKALTVSPSAVNGVEVRGTPRRHELALRQLFELAERRSPTPVFVQVEVVAEHAEVTLTAGASARLGSPQEWKVEEVGAVLGAWLARELVQSLGGTLLLEETRDPRIVARFPLAGTSPARFA